MHPLCAGMCLRRGLGRARPCVHPGHPMAAGPTWDSFAFCFFILFEFLPWMCIFNNTLRLFSKEGETKSRRAILRSGLSWAPERQRSGAAPPSLTGHCSSSWGPWVLLPVTLTLASTTTPKKYVHLIVWSACCISRTGLLVYWGVSCSPQSERKYVAERRGPFISTGPLRDCSSVLCSQFSTSPETGAVSENRQTEAGGKGEAKAVTEKIVMTKSILTWDSVGLSPYL